MMYYSITRKKLNLVIILILAVLVCNNTTVKLQVYELLCALCIFSIDGMIFVKSVLSHIKVNYSLYILLKCILKMGFDQIRCFLSFTCLLMHVIAF